MSDQCHGHVASSSPIRDWTKAQAQTHGQVPLSQKTQKSVDVPQIRYIGMIVDVPVGFQRQVPDHQWIAGEQQMFCGFSLKQFPESQRRCLAQDVSAKAHALRLSQLETFVNMSTAHMLESTEVSTVPVGRATISSSHNRSICSVQVEFLFVVATWASRATAARGQLPLAISKKHHTLFVEVSSFLTTAARSH